MYEKTTMGLVIMTILIAYISALTLSNQAFAQILEHGVNPKVPDVGGHQPQADEENTIDLETQTNVKVLGHSIQGISIYQNRH